MKASLKFRDDQKPLFRAKIPLNILGVPFQSGVSAGAGDSREVSLSLGTFFESGPSFKITYRPHDSWNPFSLAVKTGIGPFGSPVSSPMLMSAEFNLVARGNPSFFVHFRPQIGDFRIKKSVASPVAVQEEKEKALVFKPAIKSVDFDADSDDPSVAGGETPLENGLFSGKKVNGLLSENNAPGAANSLFEGVEVSARTVLPVRSRVVVGFRWAVRFPPNLENVFANKGIRDPTALISLSKIPLLVMDKISIEHVAEVRPNKNTKRGLLHSIERDADVARVCVALKRQLEVLHSESDSLRRAVQDLRSDIGAGKFVPAATKPDSGGGKPFRGKSGRDRPEMGGGFAGKTTEKDVSEELKKTLIGAAGAGT